MRNICDACEHCVFASRDPRFCIDHCDMVEHIILDLEYKRNKNKVSLYVDTDSVISKDDHAKNVDCENCKKKNTCPDKDNVYGPECVMYVSDNWGNIQPNVSDSLFIDEEAEHDSTDIIK